MEVKCYRKKPVVIQAARILDDGLGPVIEWCGGKARYDHTGDVDGITIKTLEGEMTGNVDDYIIKGVSGEFYPCKPDIFQKTYEPA